MRHRVYLLLTGILLTVAACQPARKLSAPTGTHEIEDLLSAYLPLNAMAQDDPALYDSLIPPGARYRLQVSEPWWLIPSPLLPADVQPQKSNNNISIHIFNHRLYLAFRTGPTHFASEKTGIYIISTADGTQWRKELELFFQRDQREPFLIPIDGKLHFYCFAAGENMMSFQPDFIQMYTTTGDGNWKGPVQVLGKGEVHWSMLNRNGQTYMTSYAGSHYQLKGDAQVSLYFKKTENGTDWAPVGDSAGVYFGGVSETAFEFDRTGNLWAVTRLEDGDKTGFGSHVVIAPAGDISRWEFPEKADPICYMSPKMFRHGDDIYLVARRQLGRHPFGRAKSKRSLTYQRMVNWVSFSLSPKTTALYKIDQENKQVVKVLDLPGAGDTAFPSVIRLNAHQFLVANYTSPPEKANRTWLGGQLGKTMIYLQLLTFEEE